MRNVRTICMALTLIALAGSASAQLSSIGVGIMPSPTTTPDVTVRLGDSTTSGFHIFNSSNTELFRVQANGYVGIGTPNAVANLDVRGANAHALVGSGTSDFLGSGQTGFGASNGTEKMFFGAQPALTLLGSVSNTNLGFVTNNSTKMLVDTAGNVGIGTMSPGAKLEVAGNGRFGLDFIEMPNPQYGGIQIGEFGAGGTGELEFMSCNCGLGYGYRLMGNPGDGSLRLERRANSQTWSDFMSFNAGTLGCDSNGCVGIGTTSPTSYLQIGSTYPARFEDSFTSGVLNGVVLDMAGNSEIHIGSIQIGKTAMPVIQTTGGAGASPLQLNQYSDNDVIIGSNSSAHGLLVKSLPNAVSSFAGNVTVTGTLTAGTVYANYQDVAEWVPSEGALPAGTVVVLNRVKTNAVTASSKAYDTAVAGVVSDQPGVLLGTAGDGKAKIATTGRVKVRVDARTHAVAIGDLLVTSDVPGTAMFSEPMDINGRKFHQPGTLIGKALEPLANGQGEILVLLSLQ